MSSDPWSVLIQNKTSFLTTAFLKIFLPFCVLALISWLTSDPDCAVISHALVWSRGIAKN